MVNCPKCGVPLLVTVAKDNGHPPPVPPERSTANTVPASLPSPSAPPKPATFRAAAPVNERTRLPESPAPEVGALLMRIDERALDDYERDFILKTRESFKRYGGRTRLTDKQSGFLRKIARKYAAA
jgi:hypothetical protein